MNFTTKIPIEKSKNSIDYSSQILSLGSCFAENMAAKFSYFKFQNSVNPFGIIFNPVSIENLVSRVVNNKQFTEEDIFFHNDLWHCFEVHSELSNPNKKAFLENLNQLLESTNNQITKSTHCIITYGTSWVYRFRHPETSGQSDKKTIVANCHKVPQSEFEKEILSVETIEKSIQNMIDLIKKINPNCHFIFTVSPVRHLKDGFVENQRSKAHLITAIHNSKLETLNSEYFPSYEIMMDELRDYRFYAKDMLHPSQTAIDYIWIRFFENYVAQSEFGLMNEVCEIQKALAHLPSNPNSSEHKKFLEKLQVRKDNLQKQSSHFKF